MVGEQLHQFDTRLCQNVLDNIRCYMDRPAFASYVQEQLEPPVLAYLVALGNEDVAPPPMLLTDYDFNDLAETFAMGFNRRWISYTPLHRRHIDCVAEIRAVLAPEYAEQWAHGSADYTKRLESEDTRLSNGIEAVHEWVREARRLLRALGATSLLPHPEGTFPTPSCPKPPLPAHSTDMPVSTDKMMAESLAIQREVRDLLLQQRTVKDWYSTDEVAGLLGKDPFTVREWCRRGRVNAEKKGSGRGKHQFWVISHEELQRIQRDGLLPAAAHEG